MIPDSSNREKYIAFSKTIVIAVIAECGGDLIPDPAASRVLGFDLVLNLLIYSLIELKLTKT